MITRQIFDRLFPTKGLDPRKYNLVARRDELIDALNRILPKYEIDTWLRICAFFGNSGIETDYFKTTTEYASGWDYDISVNPKKARSLGNYKKGDGPKFKGGGLGQTTGGYNYGEVQKAIGEELGIDVVKNPELLRENIDIAVESACIFWRDHGLNAYADRGDFKKLSGIVNRGDEDLTPLRWPKRNELYSKCKRYLPKDLKLGTAVTSQNYDDPAEMVTLVSNDTAPPAVPEASAETSVSFLETTLDKNVSPEEVKEVSRSAGRKALVYLARPLGLLYAALEAGNIAAWLGIVVLLVVIGLLLYWHRADIKKLVDKLKAKFTQ